MTLTISDIYNRQGVRAIVDAHVHIHDCFEIQGFFDAAASNFAFQTSDALSSITHRCILCLTESYGVDRFEELARCADETSTDTGVTDATWRFSRSSDDRCLIAGHPDLGEISVVSGRQIVTSERLEILALGSRRKWEDGLAAPDVVESIIASGAIPVLPWGFGKWLGRRGLVVEDLISRFGGRSLYIGDNSGRLGVLPDPRVFVLARESGIQVLPGSDPLPLASQCDKAGSFGFYVDDVDDCEGIWAGLRVVLKQGEGIFHRYGALESPIRFVQNQVAMQYLKRVAGRRKSS